MAGLGEGAGEPEGGGGRGCEGAKKMRRAAGSEIRGVERGVRDVWKIAGGGLSSRDILATAPGLFSLLQVRLDTYLCDKPTRAFLFL